nr:MAG TPA: hypothetical protein [Caudoviricetes sp.]
MTIRTKPKFQLRAAATAAKPFRHTIRKPSSLRGADYVHISIRRSDTENGIRKTV